LPIQLHILLIGQILRRVYRARSPGNVVDEIEGLVQKYNLKFVEFIDDTMTISRERAESIAREVIRRKLDISWGFGSRVDLVTEDMLRLFKRAVASCSIWGSSPAPSAIINALRKGISLDQVKSAIACAKKAKIETMGTFIIGSPWEAWDDVVRTINFAKSCGIDYAQFTVMTPYPGTDAYEIARSEGLLEESDWTKFTTIPPSCVQVSQQGAAG
jgi:anaerobic magnesium-protoporphyrin IX monomethyl ester cyclase